MRNAVLVGAAVLAAAAIGCGGSGPVTVTPEMEAEQKAADQKVQEEERVWQKSQKPTRKPTAEEEEAARSRRRN